MSTLAQTSQKALFGKTRAAVLGLLLLRSDEQFHLRQVARSSGQGLGAVQRELKSLTRLGIVQREQSGRQVYFQANRNCPFFSDLQGLLIKTNGIVGVLQAALLPFAKRLSVVLVFGSVARAAMNADSDIDLLVLSHDLKMRDLATPLRQAGQALGREINVNLYRPREWSKRVSDSHALARSILNNPRLLVMGDENELK